MPCRPSFKRSEFIRALELLDIRIKLKERKMRISRNVAKHIGPGGRNCPCCFPAPGSKGRKSIYRSAKRKDKRDAMRDQAVNH